MTTGVADDRDRRARSLLAHLLAEADFCAQAVAKWWAVFWMTAALAALAVAYKNGLFVAQSAH
ncbi:hypothetical protein [uncultured Campylobacter sp.]|uniref:hypothetical protein n=1 Tax=uncultured Campylobacter sp. TaxID=218934 RepID=UPI00262F211E|nr:hypothetical protein [uncultured Campylobacter sp.]